MTDAPRGPSLPRRRVLGGAAALGLAAPVLASCGSGDASAGGSGQAPEPGGSPGTDLVAAADVPVGGGVVLAELKVVVTQPAKGDFQGFSAVCTHQGCIVNRVSDGIIHCPCHGSQYSVKDGSVVGGPAPRALAPVRVAVKGGEVRRA